MSENIEDEVALALAIALYQNARAGGPAPARTARDGRGSAWRIGLERRQSIPWSRGRGWKAAARNESLRGR